MLCGLFCVLTFCACATTFPRGELAPIIERSGPDAYHVLSHQEMGPAGSDRTYIATHSKELRRLWTDLGLLSPIPAVDFTRFIVLSFLVETRGCRSELYQLDLREDGRLVPRVAELASLCNEDEVRNRFVVEVSRRALPVKGVGLSVPNAPTRVRRFRQHARVAPKNEAAPVVGVQSAPPSTLLVEELGTFPLPERGRGLLVRLADDAVAWIVRLLDGELNVVSAWEARANVPDPEWGANIAGLHRFVEWNVEAQRFLGMQSAYDARGVSLTERDLPNLAAYSFTLAPDGSALHVTGRTHSPHCIEVLARSAALFGTRDPMRLREPLELFPEPALTLAAALAMPEGSLVKLDESVDMVHSGLDRTVRLCSGPARLYKRTSPCPSDAPPVLDMHVIAAPVRQLKGDRDTDLGADPRFHLALRGPLVARRAGNGFKEVRFLNRMPEGCVWLRKPP